jgi:hypothetical protein
MGFSASCPTPNLEGQGIPFIWVITLDLSGDQEVWLSKHTTTLIMILESNEE